MKVAKTYWILGVCAVLVLPGLLNAQADLKPQTKEKEEIEEVSVGTTDVGASTAERDAFLQTLKAEVEPNLPKADLDRLNKNIMRLGSYRMDWVQSAREFLVANAPLAELFLYRYSLLKNKRLNHEILLTLVALPRYRFPKAAKAFAEVLSTSNEDKVHVLELFRKVMAQDASLTRDYLSFLAGPWGQTVSADERFYVASSNCNALPPLAIDLQPVVASWARDTSVWTKVAHSEFEACLKGR